jgi:hypothetical protein
VGRYWRRSKCTDEDIVVLERLPLEIFLVHAGINQGPDPRELAEFDAEDNRLDMDNLTNNTLIRMLQA